MSPQTLEAGSGCRNITLKVVLFLCSSFLLGAETVTKIFGVNWSYRKNTLDVYFLFFQGCEFPSRLLEVCVVMETLSRVQEGKTSLTSLWSNSADGSWKLGMGSSNSLRGIIPGSIPNYRRENSLSPGHLSASIPVPPLCLQNSPSRCCFLTAKEEGSAQGSMWSQAPALCNSRCFRPGKEQGCLQPMYRCFSWRDFIYQTVSLVLLFLSFLPYIFST